jgi:hypothetical protein
MSTNLLDQAACSNSFLKDFGAGERSEGERNAVRPFVFTVLSPASKNFDSQLQLQGCVSAIGDRI